MLWGAYFISFSCHPDAYCDQLEQCKCKNGFLGDGISCVPDRLNCQVRKNLCSEFATCIEQRCVCNVGYTGDGQMCFSLKTETNRFDCLACHCRAACVNGECRCERGFLGNGLACVPDPYDCINYPNVCHINGHCNNSTRRCECDSNHIGNGYDCVQRRSCINNSGLCNKNADCLISGQCKCRDGYYGDGYICETSLTTANSKLASSKPLSCPGVCSKNSECINGACKCLPGYVFNPNGFCIDVDECRTGAFACHSTARCLNSDGSYTCKCPDGMVGDGKECLYANTTQVDLKVQCATDGIRVILSEEDKPFVGYVYVDGQRENPHCSKTFDAEKGYPTAQQSDTFYIPVTHCNMRLENYNTLAATIVVQKHSVFVTEKTYTYKIRCTYPLDIGQVEAKVGIDDVETSVVPVATNQHIGPTCNFSVKNLENIMVNSAVVGQVLKLLLSVEPSQKYSIKPKNCFAINLETSEKHRLTEENGCTSNTDLFPEWTQTSSSQVQAIFRMFKWPESRMVRFECDCAPCLGGCPEVDCGQQIYRTKRHPLRFVREASRKSESATNSTSDSAVTSQESESNWMKNLVTSPRKTALSSVIYVREKQESEETQREFEEWLNKDSTHEGNRILTSSTICFGDTWPLLLVAAILLLLAGASLLFLFHQLSQVRKGDRKNLQHASSLGNLSSYIQF